MILQIFLRSVFYIVADRRGCFVALFFFCRRVCFFRAAHVGGLVAGILVGWALFHKSTEESRVLREPLLKKAIRLQGKSESPRFKTQQVGVTV